MDTRYKYQPRNLKEFAFSSTKLEEEILRYATGATEKPLILHGPTGTGKTTLAKLIPEAIDGTNVIVDRIVAEDLNSNKEVRAQFTRPIQFDKFFVPTNQKHSYTIIEEVNFDPKAKGALRQCLDDMQGRGIYIFTTNELSKIDPMIQDRCNVVEVLPCTPDRFFARAKYILEAEGIFCDEELIHEVLQNTHACNKSNRAYYDSLDRIIEGWQQPKAQMLPNLMAT